MGVKLAQENERAAYLAGQAGKVAECIGDRLALEADAAEAPLDLTDSAFVEWSERGRDRGLNFDREVAVAIARLVLERAGLPAGVRGLWQHNLGTALRALGRREAGTERLKDAVKAYRAALLERTQERVPLDWAVPQYNLDTALANLGEHKGDAARLEKAVEAYRAALLELTRERVPLQCAAATLSFCRAQALIAERQRNPTPLAQLEARAREARQALVDGGNTQGAGWGDHVLGEIARVRSALVC